MKSRNLKREVKALRRLRKAAEEIGIELVLKHADREEAMNIANDFEELLGQMESDALEGEEEFTIDVYRPWALEEGDSPADQGNAAVTADALHDQIVADTAKLVAKVSDLRSAWDKAGYSKDDGVRDDLLLHALDIAGELAKPNSDACADHSSMQKLANDAQNLAINLTDIAVDLEDEG